MKLALHNLTLLFAVVFWIFHHIFHTFHLATHLNNLLRSINHLVYWRQERGHKTLKGHQHAHCELTLQNQIGAQNQYSNTHNTVSQNGKNRHSRLLFVGIGINVKLMSPQTTPILKESRFGTRSLDTLHIVDTRHSGRIILTLTLLHRTNQIDTQGCVILYDGQVNACRQNANHSQPEGVRQHQSQIEHQ